METKGNPRVQRLRIWPQDLKRAVKLLTDNIRKGVHTFSFKAFPFEWYLKFDSNRCHCPPLKVLTDIYTGSVKYFFCITWNSWSRLGTEDYHIVPFN
jgi:hypothetical protein